MQKCISILMGAGCVLLLYKATPMTAEKVCLSGQVFFVCCAKSCWLGPVDYSQNTPSSHIHTYMHYIYIYSLAWVDFHERTLSEREARSLAAVIYVGC